MYQTDNFLNDSYDYIEPDIEEGYYPCDYTIDKAKRDIANFIEEHKSEVFYIRQLEVIFEKKYFHWITAKAIKEFEDEGFLSSKMEQIGSGVNRKLWRLRDDI